MGTIISELVKTDADIIGLSEFEALGGNHPEKFMQMVSGMQNVGYSHQYFDRADALSSSVVFWK